MSAISFFVHGMPVPQGSKKVIKGRLIEMADARLRNWRQDVASAAHNARIEAKLPRFEGPVAVRLAFTLPRPKAHYGTGRNATKLKPSAPDYPAVSPDLDKLIRAVLDALTHVVFLDDRQVVVLDVGKWYATQTGLQAEVVSLVREVDGQGDVADGQEQEDQNPG